MKAAAVAVVAVVLLAASGWAAEEQQQQQERHEFKAEVNRLMDLLVHSLYTNKEVFVRELLSNGNDALDKLRFLALTNSSAYAPASVGDALEIKVFAVPEDGTLHFRDTGIGMTREELVTNLGTVAQSGTLEFLRKASEANKKDAAAAAAETSLIGQFGVGFYSAFLVSDRVTVFSKSNDDPDQHVWESDASGYFTVARDPRGATLGRGTEIVLHIKESERAKWLDTTALADTIKKYAEFINFPIRLWVHKPAEKPAAVEDEGLEEEEEEAAAVIGDEEEKAKEAAEEKPATEEWEWELMNSVKPIWMRKPKEVTDEEYNAFYKAITNDPEPPLAWTHFKAEGDAEFRALLFIPRRMPTALWDPSPSAHAKDVRLYVKHVFVTGMAIDVVPPWLRFVRGVVDSDDLPINIGREQVQESSALEAIKLKVVRKIIATIQELFKDDRSGKYKDFYEQFSTAIKLGCTEDLHNRDRLEKLLMFPSTKTAGTENQTTFAEYVERMEEMNKQRKKELRQDQILYLGGESLEAVSRSPLLERLVRAGHEVIFAVEPIDEYLFDNLGRAAKFRLTNIAREGVKLPFLIDDDKEKQATESVSELAEWLQSRLSAEVEKVVASPKLTTTPAAVVGSMWGPTANIERILKAQALAKTGSSKVPYMQNRRVLEINPGHPLVQELRARVAAAKADGTLDENKQLDRLAKLLYHTALVSGGFSLDDVAPDFVGEVHALMASTLGVAPDAPIQEVEMEVPIVPEEAEAEADAATSSEKEEL